MAGINVIFNTTSIQTSNVIVQHIDHESIPQKTTTKFPTARANSTTATSSYYKHKPIIVTGQVIGTSIADTDSRADSFKQNMLNMTGLSANLDIDYAGGTRRYLATIDDCQVTPSDALFARNFTLTFDSLLPFGQATSATTLANAVAVTTTPFTQALTIGGTSQEQVPQISYTLSAFTGSSTNTIYFKNNTTGQQVSITRIWTAADIVIINPYTAIVTVNGTAVDYDGVCPTFAPGSVNLIVSDGFATRTGSLTVTQTYRYW